MENYKELYKKRKQRIIDLLEEVSLFFSKYENKSSAEYLRSFSENLEKGKFSVVVVGEFSAGKSTFLNALMGKRYLPAYISETTATINFLRSVNESPIGKECLLITYKSGKTLCVEDTSIESVEKYVCTKGKNVATEIKSVELFLNSPFLNDGVSLVDSPGLNGVLKHHRKITEEQIHKSHASIFMFRANQPGTLSDFEILKQLKNDSKNSLFIVLNRIDEIQDCEETVDEIIAKLRENYRHYFPDDPLPKIWPLAALPALVARSDEKLSYRNYNNYTTEEKAKLLQNSQIEKFEQRLLRFLTKGEKARDELLTPVLKTIALLNDSEKELREQIVELSQANGTLEVEEQIQALKEELLQLEVKLEEQEADIRIEIQDIVSRRQAELKDSMAAVRNRYLNIMGDSEILELLQQDAEIYLKRINMEFSYLFNELHRQIESDIRDVVKLNFRQYTGKIEDKINFVPAGDEKITADFKLDGSIFAMDANLDDFNKEKEKLESELKLIYRDLDEMGERGLLTKAAEEKKMELEIKLENLKKEKNHSLTLLGPKPGKQEVVEYVSEKSGGLIGGIKWILNGNPEVQKPYRKLDDSAQRSHETHYNQYKEQYDAEIRKLQENLDSIHVEDSSLQFEYAQKRLERTKEAGEKKLKQLTEKLDKKLKEYEKSKIRKAKSYLEDLMLEIDNTASREMRDKMTQRVRTLSKDLVGLLLEGLEMLITQKKDALELKHKQLTLAVDEKERLINRYTQQCKEIEPLVQQAISEQEELKQAMTDFIETKQDENETVG